MRTAKKKKKTQKLEELNNWFEWAVAFGTADSEFFLTTHQENIDFTY